MISFNAHGKLLLTAEYAVLDGALALALPTRFGQSLEVQPTSELLQWQSFDADGSRWFEAEIDFVNQSINASSDKMVASRLLQVLNAAKTLNQDFIPSGSVNTRLEFSRHWGLGSSSTLISNIASWAGVNPFELLQATFSGSGYDIACAGATGPIWFQRINSQLESKPADFHPPFASHLSFAYLGQKQDSREGIRRYRAKAGDLPKHWIREISLISEEMAKSKNIVEFELLMKAHEILISDALELVPVQKSLFPDFWGTIKSLGAWGGDFVMVASQEDALETKSYLAEKGINTVFSWDELIL